MLSELSCTLNKPDPLSWAPLFLQLDTGGLWKAERKRQIMKASVRLKALADFYHWIKQHLRIQVGLIFSLLNVLRLDNWLCYPETFGWLVHIQLTFRHVHLDENSSLIGTPQLLFEPKICSAAIKRTDVNSGDTDPKAGLCSSWFWQVPAEPQWHPLPVLSIFCAQWSAPASKISILPLASCTLTAQPNAPWTHLAWLSGVSPAVPGGGDRSRTEGLKVLMRPEWHTEVRWFLHPTGSTLLIH